MAASFVDHCTAQGITPGAVLNSLLDATSAVVLSVHNADMYFPARVVTTLHWNGQRYSMGLAHHAR